MEIVNADTDGVFVLEPLKQRGKYQHLAKTVDLIATVSVHIKIRGQNDEDSLCS